MTPAEENRCVAALLRLASHVNEERAARYFDGEERAALDSEADKEALRLASDHGIDGTRLRAYDHLARSRGVRLDVVLRYALRGDLREVIVMPHRSSAVRGPEDDCS
jgi:hypothetical protein